jgi:regulator of sigma E protease
MIWVLAILALGLLILVHEAGHMWIARLCGMRVDKFSIFFGPPILRWRGNKTTYQLGTVPIGGYVQIAGMHPEEPLAADDAGSYQNKAAWRRFATVFAGPGINYIFAILIMLFVTIFWGLPIQRLMVGSVGKNGAAAAAGLQQGDEIASIDGKSVSTRAAITAIQTSGGKQMTFGVIRNGKRVSLPVTPRKTDKGYKIGVGFSASFKFEKIGIGTAAAASFSYPVHVTTQTLGSLADAISKQFDKKAKTKPSLGGPIEIVRQIKVHFEFGFVTALLFLAKLNVLLGLFNLLPIPALDGGRMVFLGIEMVFRRPVNQRVEALVHTAGFFVLFGLILLFTYGDLKRMLAT